MTTDEPEPESESRDDRQTITVEAEYSFHDESHCNEWTFDSLTPGEARDRVITTLVPLDATLFRYAVWYGTSDDRPAEDTDTEFIPLDVIEDTAPP